MTGSVTADPLRIGVLGAARIADLAIVQPARLTGHRLVAVAARDHRRAEDFAQRHGVERALPSYADVLADPEVEAIYNPLANALHGPWNLAAIQAGKPVLSEKPFASNADEARAVRDAAAAAHVTVMEGFHYLYHPVTAGCTNCWTAANSASCARSRPTCSCRPPPTATRAGPTNWPAAR